MISFQELQKHTSEDDLWTLIHGTVYDITEFVHQHPGGKGVILKTTGRDATQAFSQVHSIDILQMLPSSAIKGKIIISTVPKQLAEEKSKEVIRPPIGSILNMADFEALAEKVMAKEAWAYYSSAADDEITVKQNQTDFQKFPLKPKALVNVKDVDPSTTLFGVKSSLPIYITATAMGKLGHPAGEVNFTKAAGKKGIIQMIPTLSSCSLDEMTSARIDGQTQWFQLYVNEDRNLTLATIKKSERLGAKVLCVTVDTPMLGRRERDMRLKFVDEAPNSLQETLLKNKDEGVARAISGWISPSFCWKDIPWLLKVSKNPVVLKGIQNGEDAVLAVKAGVSGIIVSNHGGRQLDSVRSTIEMLQEVMDALNRSNLAKKVEVYMDGGIRRGTDIYKALAMGAKAVGLGRPFLYAMSTYGQEGVEKAIDLLREEFEMVMRLMGTPRICDIKRDRIYELNKSKL